MSSQLTQLLPELTSLPHFGHKIDQFTWRPDPTVKHWRRVNHRGPLYLNQIRSKLLHVWSLALKYTTPALAHYNPSPHKTVISAQKEERILLTKFPFVSSIRMLLDIWVHRLCIVTSFIPRKVFIDCLFFSTIFQKGQMKSFCLEGPLNFLYLIVLFFAPIL